MKNSQGTPPANFLRVSQSFSRKRQTSKKSVSKSSVYVIMALSMSLEEGDSHADS